MDWKKCGKGHYCPNCRKSDLVVYRTHESYGGGHEDYQYWCKKCTSKWWVDGVDS